MILWLTGNTGSGKTTLAHKMAKGQRNTIVLDGDDLRQVWPGLTMHEDHRAEQCMRTARLARYLESQGMTVIVAVIAPFEWLRRDIHTICGCNWIYMKGGMPDSDVTPYKPPIDAVMECEKHED